MDRTEVKIDVFEMLEIPLPTIRRAGPRFVLAYSTALDHAARLEQEAQAIEDAGLRAFEAALGVSRAAALAGATGVRGTVQGHRAVES